MPSLVDQAVVLRLWDFSETSQTVSLLCRSRGALRGLAKGARRERSSFGGGFDLLTRGEIVALLKPASELATLTEWDLQEVFWAPRRHLAAHRAAMYLIDLVHHAVVDHDPHPGLFDALVRALRALDEPRLVAPVLTWFGWRVLSEIGLRPWLGQEDPPGPDSAVLLFDPRAGGLVGAGSSGGPTTSPSRVQARPMPRSERSAAGHAGPWRVRAQTVRLLRRLEVDPELGPEALSGLADEAVVLRAGRLLAEYSREAVGAALATRHAAFAGGS